MKQQLLLLVTVGLLLIASTLHGADSASPWNIKTLTEAGKVEYDFATGMVTAEGGVLVSYRGQKGEQAELSARQLSLNQITGDARAEGSVFLRGEGQTWRGEKLEYNFRTKVMRSDEFRTGHPPFFAGGMGLGASVSSNSYTATNGFFTTDDLAEPYYRVRCKELTVIPGEKIIADQATVYLGDTPVFYWPRYVRSLKRHPNNWVLLPGYRSLYGPYLLSAYNWNPTDWFSGTARFDYRQRRGPGVGPDFKLDLGDWGQTEFRGYYTHDDRPGTNTLGAVIDDDRHRIRFAHRADIRTNFTAKVVVHHQGDPFVVRDFFEWEYRDNIQPLSFAEVNYLWENFSLNVLTTPRINDFYERIERLPDVRFSGLRQQLGATPLYYESDSSAGYFSHEFANNALPSFKAWRADTYHQVVLPQNYFGWLNFTPRVGGRFTSYGESEGGFVGPEADRWVFNTGAEVSFKMSRTWPEKELPWFGGKGLRHIVEPSVNYVFIPSPNKLPPQLPQFDPLIPSLRLLPLEFPEFNAIDAVDSENTFRFGFRNHVQTKRDGRVDTLLNWNLVADWHVKHRPDQETFSDVFSDFDFKPRDWLTLTSETRYDVADGVFRIADHRATIAPADYWSASLGHRYLRNDPALGPNSGHNLVLAGAYYRLNENWSFRVWQQIETRDGVLEEQSYVLYRDFRSWVGALTLRLRQNRGTADDLTIGFTFSLKAFPRYGLGSDSFNPSYLLGDSAGGY